MDDDLAPRVARRRRDRHPRRARADRRRHRRRPAARRQPPLDPGRPHRSVEPRRGGHGPRPRRPPRRRPRRLRVAGRQATRRRRLARVLPRRRGRGPDARHQRHLLHRHRRVAPPPRHRRHRVPATAVAGGRGRHRLRPRLPAGDGRDRVARRRPRRRRAPHRIVEHPSQPEVRDRHRRSPRSRSARLGAVARRARDRDRAPTRPVPRQGPVGDGLVLPDPRWRLARLSGRRPCGVAVGDVRGARIAAPVASPTVPG